MHAVADLISKNTYSAMAWWLKWVVLDTKPLAFAREQKAVKDTAQDGGKAAGKDDRAGQKGKSKRSKRSRRRARRDSKTDIDVSALPMAEEYYDATGKPD